MKLVDNVKVLDQIFENFFKKDTLSNNYMLKDEYLKHIGDKKLFYTQDESNIYFFIQKANFYRLYYFINDHEKVFNVSYNLPIVLEILYRGNKNFPRIQQAFWLQSSFESHITRDCYFLKNKEILKIESNVSLKIKLAGSLEEIQYVKHLMDLHLDLYTGDNLSFDEIRQFSKDDLVYIAYSEGMPCGFLQAELKNSVFWLGHIVVDSAFRGKGIASALVNYYINQGKQKNCNQFQLWVIKDNTPAIKLYKKFGFTYLNKSTYSMLKK